MIIEWGHWALHAALWLAVLQTLSVLGRGRAAAPWLPVRTLAGLQVTALTVAFAALLWAFGTNEFSLAYVAAHANTRLPLAYRLAGSWGGHEGSLLLWVWMLGLWQAALLIAGRHDAPGSEARAFEARALAVLGAIATGFLAFLLFSSNPFERHWPAPADGRDLNPLLQDPGLVFHPPLLYMGYVGFAVAFAQAVAALWQGRVGREEARRLRPWALRAWAFLSAGILLGSFWAYYELGWGGWWFWDAVENASFMPWLIGAALVHSLAVALKRDRFRHWTLLLALLGFALSLLGTFLVRSGVLSSVHAFASDPMRGSVLLVLLALAVGVPLALYAWRAPVLGQGDPIEPASRESLLLLNNVFLCASAATVLLGTLYPLALDVLGGERISVGAPYFEAVFVPLALPLLALAGLTPFVPWGRLDRRALWRQVRALLLGAVLGGALLGYALRYSLLGSLSLALALWLLLATVAQLVQQLRDRAANHGWLGSWQRTPRAQWGQWIAHLGLAVFVLGVSAVKSLEQSQDVALRPGGRVALAGLEFRFLDMRRVEGPNYIAAQARFEVWADGQRRAELRPEKRFYPVPSMPMTEAAIDRGLWRDLYLSLAEAQADGAWGLRVQVKPGMTALWLGAALMGVGALWAGAPRARRRAVAASAPAAPPTSWSRPLGACE
jgi:cytochrome c-type biogenesis protein CcmF